MLERKRVDLFLGHQVFVQEGLMSFYFIGNTMLRLFIALKNSCLNHTIGGVVEKEFVYTSNVVPNGFV